MESRGFIYNWWINDQERNFSHSIINMWSPGHPTRWWFHPSGSSSLGRPHHSCTLPPPSASLLLLLSLFAPPPLPLQPRPPPPASGGRCTQTWRRRSGCCSAQRWCRSWPHPTWEQHSRRAVRGRRLPGDAAFASGPGAKPWGRSAWSRLGGFAHWPRWSPLCRRSSQACCRGMREAGIIYKPL